MEQTIFNWHDLILILTAFECVIASVLVLTFYRPIPHLFGLLGLLLACYAFIALNEVILWGATFRYWILEASPNIFFCLSVSYFCVGPLLWLLANRLINNPLDKRLSLVHFIPAIMVLIYLWLTFWSLPSAEKVFLIKNYYFDNSWHYPWVELAGGAQRWVYSALAIRLIWPLLKIENNSIHMPTNEGRILLSFVFVVLCMELVLAVLKVANTLKFTPFTWLGDFSLTINYANFILVNLFLYTWLKLNYTPKTVHTLNKAQVISDEHIKAIENGIHRQMLYLNPNLSVERFAKALDILPKDLSHAINRHYGITFIEFINQHRLEEARRLLKDSSKTHLSITDIFYQAGFNSKSVYNKLFKTKFHCTPSQYRKK